MKLLIDTHVLIWMSLAKESLSQKAQAQLEDPNNILFFSVATLWEMAIKESTKKLILPKGSLEFFKKSQSSYDIQLLSIEPKHLKLLKALPQHHRDPFDRLLVCQASAEDLSIVTKDLDIKKYRVKTVW